MKPLVRVVAIVVVLSVAALAAWLIWRPKPADADVLSGYIEGEALYLSAPVAGPVAKVSVVRGQRVQAGDPLFAMDAQTLQATREQGDARIAQAEAGVSQANAAITQAQASLGQLRADAGAAHSAADTAARDAARYTALERLGQGAVSAQEADRARLSAATTADQAKAADQRLAAAAAQIAGAGAGAAQARAGALQARAGLTETRVKLDQLAPRAPGPARVEEVYFQAGEWAAANQPVVSLLPDAKVKLRFFVPEKEAALYRPGGTVSFTCDSCGQARSARIAYVSPRPEFTPPVIYSRKTRDRLVFLVEAEPTGASGLTPGLPVDVTPLGRAR